MFEWQIDCGRLDQCLHQRKHIRLCKCVCMCVKDLDREFNRIDVGVSLFVNV